MSFERGSICHLRRPATRLSQCVLAERRCLVVGQEPPAQIIEWRRLSALAICVLLLERLKRLRSLRMHSLDEPLERLDQQLKLIACRAWSTCCSLGGFGVSYIDSSDYFQLGEHYQSTCTLASTVYLQHKSRALTCVACFAVLWLWVSTGLGFGGVRSTKPTPFNLPEGKWLQAAKRLDLPGATTQQLLLQWLC